MTETEPENEDRGSPDGFLVSVVVCIAALVAVEVFFRGSLLDQKLKKDSNYITAKALDYEAQGGDIVVTGDSRMFHAVIPHVMQQVLQEKKGQAYTTYNFGIPSGTTPTFLMVATEAAHHKPRPKVFIIGLNPAAFSCCDTVSAVGTSAGVQWKMAPWLVRATWRDNTEEAGASVAYGASRLLATRTELAYAVSIHKSQGSEFPAVVIPLLGEHHVMLRRNLLYTAVTRARRLCLIVGDPRALTQAVHRGDAARRFTGLSERLLAALRSQLGETEFVADE